LLYHYSCIRSWFILVYPGAANIAALSSSTSIFWLKAYSVNQIGLYVIVFIDNYSFFLAVAQN